VVVVDTDVVSFLFKQDTRADLYKPHLKGHALSALRKALETRATTGSHGRGLTIKCLSSPP
jgi:hypothetical protein